jgi:DNA-binding CsgD family transcriptional regulator
MAADPGRTATGERGIALFGDVASSRRDPVRSSRWLRLLAGELDERFTGVRRAHFGFTQGDELQGLLAPEADPFAAILWASLQADALPMRWSVGAGRVDRGRGPATQRTGEAFLAARQALIRARAQRDGLVVVTGDSSTDTLLADVAPLYPILLGDLTTRQREIGRLMLVDGMRQADVAERLHVARPTVSVAVERARLREIERLGQALLTLLRHGATATLGEANAAS